MLPKSLFSEADLAALGNIVAACADAGLWIEWEDTHRFVARSGAGCSVLTRIAPASYDEGISCTGCSSTGRKIFDGHSSGFVPGGKNLRALSDWLAQKLS